MAKSSQGSKPKVYAVARGHVPGIYMTWRECQAQVSGFSNNCFKSFATHDEARLFIKANSSAASTDMMVKDVSKKKRSHENVFDSALTKTTDTQKRTKMKQLDNNVDTTNKKLHCYDPHLIITIHFDGGSRGNPGLAGAGAEVRVNSLTYFIREFCGDRKTNNYAEYSGLIAGLQKAKLCIKSHTDESFVHFTSEKPLFSLNIFGDSNLVIQQLRGNWQCKHDNIKPLYKQCCELIKELSLLDSNSKISYEHVYRENNKTADELANEAMDHRRSWITSSLMESRDAIEC